jgi:hypothetical protein
MKIKDFSIRALKHSYRFITRKKFYGPNCEIDRQKANDIIYDALKSDDALMVSRFGTTELNCINNYLCIKSKRSFFYKLIDYITDSTHTPWWNESHFKIMSLYSGIFPPSVDTSQRFSERYLQDIPLIDILGTFQYEEKFMPLKNDIKRLQLETLYPFFVKNPWTRALRGKKVLVVHPFESTIIEQYEKRKLLFHEDNILPDFELMTIKAVQSVADTKVSFKNWFEALKFMENKISEMDFDICILGCGAYGLPLAAHVKRMGKKAIHLGGGTQLLFGIKGKRWEVDYVTDWEYQPSKFINLNYSSLFNEHWTYPKDNEKPLKAQKVEGACYW